MLSPPAPGRIATRSDKEGWTDAEAHVAAASRGGDRLAGGGPQARCQPPDGEFGVLKTTPATPLPSGVEPISSPLSSPQSRTPAPRTNPYPVTLQVGPWLICVAHYVGYEGFTLAQQVALELRDKHHLAAYIYNRGDEERRQQEEEWQKYKAKYPPGTPLRRKGVRIQDQYAVLVGGFPNIDAASAFLPTIKKLPLPTLTLEGDKPPYDMMRYQELDPQTNKMVIKQAPINPYHNAMVVRNPLTPGSQTNKRKWDPLWVKLNADEEYSLLKNPKPWTLIVKEYAGYQVIQTSADANGGSKGLLGSLGLGSTGGESLDLAAKQARELAKFLSNPQFGFKTYVLHTRNSSVVAVGGFNGPDDPELQRLQQQLTRFNFSTKDKPGDPIGLLAKPIPIEVPHP